MVAGSKRSPYRFSVHNVALGTIGNAAWIRVSSSGSDLVDERPCETELPMWNYPKSPLHQAAIDNQKQDRDRETARATAAATKLNRKLDREQTAKKALAKYEIDRLAILAKTKRLRAERLARIDAEPKKPTKV